MPKVLKSDASAADAYARFNFSLQSEVWATFDWLITAATRTFFIDNSPSASIVQVRYSAGGNSSVRITSDSVDPFWQLLTGPGGILADGPSADTYQKIEFHFLTDGTTELYIDTLLVGTHAASNVGDVNEFYIGQRQGSINDPLCVTYTKNVKLGTTRGASDLFADDFSSGDLSLWSSTFGDVSVIDDPFAPNIRFGYDGRNRITANLFAATPGDEYIMFSSAEISSVDEVADSESLSLSASAAQDKSDGDNFTVSLQDKTGASIFGVDTLANVVLTKGTSGGQFPFDAIWNYDGDKTVEVTFDTIDGIQYGLRISTIADQSSSETGSSEPTWPVVAANESVQDGDYMEVSQGNLWTWVANSAPAFNSHWGGPMIYKNSKLWKGQQISGPNTGSSEPSWTSTPVNDGGWRWTRQVYEISVWSANTHYSNANGQEYVLPTTPNGFFYRIGLSQFQQCFGTGQGGRDGYITGDGTNQTISLILDLAPIGTFSATLYDDLPAGRPISTRTFTAGEA